MKQELQEQLYKKYPKIFRQKDLPMSETCMCWGLEVPDSWYEIIDTLCWLIQNEVDQSDNKLEQIEATQVKEKFGYLRFYTHGGHNERIEGYIRFAENMTSKICYKCGSMNDITQTKGWIMYICKDCLNQNK